ncbi:hypothetical protein BKA93DRAFT_769311 [Sparassis latifolia]
MRLPTHLGLLNPDHFQGRLCTHVGVFPDKIRHGGYITGTRLPFNRPQKTRMSDKWRRKLCHLRNAHPHDLILWALSCPFTIGHAHAGYAEHRCADHVVSSCRLTDHLVHHDTTRHLPTFTPISEQMLLISLRSRAVILRTNFSGWAFPAQ